MDILNYKILLNLEKNVLHNLENKKKINQKFYFTKKIIILWLIGIQIKNIRECSYKFIKILRPII